MSLKSVLIARETKKRVFDINELVESLNAMPNTVGGPITVSKRAAEVVISSESFDSVSQDVRDECAGVFKALEGHLQQFGFESYNAGRHDATRLNDNQVAAAVLANLGASEEVRYKRALRSMTVAQGSSDPNVHVMTPSFAGPYGAISALTDGRGLENYNEKSQRDFRVISIAYNLSAARQDAFGEALYPTVVVNPTEGGVTQNVTYAAVMRDVFHKTTGALFDTKEVNIVEAFRDATVLDDSSTKIVPIVESDNSNAAMFVAEATLPFQNVVLENGATVETSALKIGAKFDLLGISNRSALLAANLLDISDTIDPAMRLKTVYLLTENTAVAPAPSNAKVIKFAVDRMPTSVFQPALAGDSRNANLVFNTDDLVINGETTAVDGSKNDVMTAITTGEYTLRLSVGVTGSVSTSKGDTFLSATPVSVISLTDVDGTAVSTTAGAGQAIVDGLGAMTIIGYDLEARFTNTNRRERGQLLQTRTVQFRYAIPLHSPITLPMSTLDENGPGDVVKSLTVATNVRNSNNAVTRLLNYVAQLRAVVGSGYSRPKFGAVEGALSVMVRPTYRYGELDLETAIDGIRSKDRWDDVCAVILDRIKSLLLPAYRDSNIESAFRTISGNADERPKFIIATDKEIANYLLVSGDNRTLGAYLKYDIVATADSRFDGKIVVVPTRENPVENDILSFGQFYYVPTIIADLPISRHGQISREIAAVPFNLHVNNIPFAIEIDVRNLKEVMGDSIYNQVIAP